MRPIPDKYLKYTFTIYNRFRDPETGEVALYRTVLRKCFQESVRDSLSVNTSGSTKLYRRMMWIDRRSTVALGAGGEKKTFLDEYDWRADGVARDAFWTLQVGDLVLGGEGQAATIAEVTAGKHFKVQSIDPIFDKDGSIHHWECEIV